MAIDFDGGRAETNLTQEEKIERLKNRWDSFSDEEKKFIKKLIAEDKDNAEEFINNLKKSHYVREPVGIREFLESPYYAGEQVESLYPKLKEDLINIIENDYFEVIMTGATRYGKSWVALYGLMYYIYRLTCYRKPAKAHGLAPNSDIWFALLSTTQKQAGRTLFSDLKSRILNSPYFTEKVGCSESNFDRYEAEITDQIKIMAESSSADSFIGTNLFGMLMDEVNYGSNNKKVEKDSLHERGTVTRIEKVYNKAAKRIKGTFMDSGVIEGIMFVISSRNTLSDFTDKRIANSKNDPNVYVMDYTQWDTKPEDSYSDDTFRVFFGGKNMKSRILEDGEDPPETNDPLAEVIEVPVDYYDDFEEDIEEALRDMAGKSVPQFTPWLHDTDQLRFFHADREDEHPMNHWSYRSNPEQGININWDEICQEKEVSQPGGYQDTVTVPKVRPNAARFAHIDMSKNGDATGLCIGHIEKMVDVPVKTEGSKSDRRELRPLVYVDFILQVLPPQEGEIDYEDLRSIIYDFIDNGFMITYVSTDRYQSVEMRQQLRKQGLETEIRSLDTKTTGYDFLKTAIKQKRIRSYYHDVLYDELRNLQKDNLKDKIDHPDDGSKDISDALAGVVWALTEKKPSSEPPVVGNKKNQKNRKHPLNQWEDVGGPAHRKHKKKNRGNHSGPDTSNDQWVWDDDDDSPMFIVG